MASIQFPFDFQRLNRTPIDVTDVFDSLVEFEAYLTAGPAYAGQICAVRNGTNEPDLYVVNEDKTYDPVGSGDGGGGGNATRIQGRPISPIAPEVGQVLLWTGSIWMPVSLPVDAITIFDADVPGGPTEWDVDVPGGPTYWDLP